MTELFTDLHAIADSELFASRMEMVKYMMLRLVRQNETGLGAWEIQVSLREAGIELITATADTNVAIRQTLRKLLLFIANFLIFVKLFFFILFLRCKVTAF